MSERLQKVLAGLGLGSRREIEGWIRDGRIEVNKTVARLGIQVDADDRVTLDGRVIPILTTARPVTRVIAYHKAVDEVCTRKDPEGRPSIFDRLPKLKQGRWVLVGRLDINTSGLVLLSNDGELAHRLMHPSSDIEREYAVRILGAVDQEMLTRLREGVDLEDGRASFERLRDAGGTGANHWYHVILREGRKREVRRLWESQGVRVSRLIRLRYGCVTLPRSLRAGRCQDLDPAVLVELMALVDMKPVIAAEAGEATRYQRRMPGPPRNNVYAKAGRRRSSGQGKPDRSRGRQGGGKHRSR